MTKIDFINSNLAKELLLFDIYDVDEFVLREVERIKNSNYLNIWDVSKARRISFEITQVNENKYEEDEISKEEYLFQKELDNNRCFTKLNYEDFEQNFPLEELDTWYGDEWLYDFQYNEAFLQSAINWIDETDGDSSKKLRIRGLINEIKRSQFALGNIKHGWSKNIPVNKIQEKAIQIFKRFDDVMLEGITAHYKDIFPELFDKKNPNKEKQSQDLEANPFPEIFKDDTYFKFKEYTDKHIVEPYVDFSYLFQRMLDEKLIHRKKHKEYIEWLFENEFISEKKRDKFLDLRGFRSLNKSREDNRVNNFNNIFKI